MTSTSSDDYNNEELVWSWTTPIDDDAAADKVSGMSMEDRLDSALPTSDDGREADDSRRPIEDDEGSDSAFVGRESISHEDLGVRNDRRAQPPDASRGVASGGVMVAETNRAPVLRKLDRKAILRFLEDLSIQEMADTLRLSIGTVKSRLHYARLALRREMEELVRD